MSHLIQMVEECIEIFIQYLDTFHSFLFQNIFTVEISFLLLLMLKENFLHKIISDNDRDLSHTKTNIFSSSKENEYTVWHNLFNKL